MKSHLLDIICKYMIGNDGKQYGGFRLKKNTWKKHNVSMFTNCLEGYIVKTAEQRD